MLVLGIAVATVRCTKCSAIRWLRNSPGVVAPSAKICYAASVTRLVLISDTHSLHSEIPSIPEGDILIHAGDLTSRGKLNELPEVRAFFDSLPHQHKIVICGNHDFCFEHESQAARARLSNVTYLEDAGTVVDGLKIYGSPWQPWFHDWAFNLPRGEPLRRVWAQIPSDTDILITHGPPAGILDTVESGLQVGCEDLLARVTEINPKLHVFGHIHEAYGIKIQGHTTFVNASICDIHYRPINAPIVIDL